MRELAVVRFVCPVCAQRNNVVYLVGAANRLPTDAANHPVAGDQFVNVHGCYELVPLAGNPAHLKLGLPSLVGFTPAPLGGPVRLGVVVSPPL
jgi:hypothetical protein